MSVRDHPLLSLQPRGDRGREDIQQKALRPCLRPLARAYEVLQEHVRRGGQAQDVESEECDYEAVRDIGRARGEGRVDPDRYDDETYEGHEPGDCLTPPDKQERTQRRCERPQRDGRRSLETAEAPLQGEWQHQAHPELAPPEQQTPPRTREVVDAWRPRRADRRRE